MEYKIAQKKIIILKYMTPLQKDKEFPKAA